MQGTYKLTPVCTHTFKQCSFSLIHLKIMSKANFHSSIQLETIAVNLTDFDSRFLCSSETIFPEAML